MHAEGRFSRAAADFLQYDRENIGVSETPQWLWEPLSLCVLAITTAEFCGRKWGGHVSLTSVLWVAWNASAMRVTFCLPQQGANKSPGIAGSTCSTVKWTKYMHYKFGALPSGNIKEADFNINRMGVCLYVYLIVTFQAVKYPEAFPWPRSHVNANFPSLPGVTHWEPWFSSSGHRACVFYSDSLLSAWNISQCWAIKIGEHLKSGSLQA